MKQLNKKGVIEIIVITALLVLTYTLAQALVVPFWDKEVEAAHIDVAYDNMTSLQSDIEDVAHHGTQKSSIVQLGVLYPNRILFFNPGPGAAGSITVEDVGITGSYTASGVSTHPINYNSSRIIYDLNGMIHSPKLVYEHGIIIWDWGAEGNVTADNQSLINVDTGNVHIPVVNAKPCTTSGQEATKIFDIYPYRTTSDCTYAESVTITLDTDYPALWQDLLSDYIKAGMVSVSNQTKTITICSSALPYISLPAQPAQEAVSAGIITCSKELPPGAVLTIPAAISWNATAGKNVTATQTSTQTSTLSLTVTRTPTPTASSRVFGGGGGGGGVVIIEEPPKVSTEDATNIAAVSATLNMAFDFNDYDLVQVQFKYKEGEEIEWDETGWVLRAGSGSQCYSETIVNLYADTTYYFMALLLYETTEIEGVEKSFTTLAPTPTPTPTPTLKPMPMPTPTPTLKPMLKPMPMPTPRPTVKPSPTPRSRPKPSIAPRPTISSKPRPIL